MAAMDIDEPTLSQRAAEAIRRELGGLGWSKSELARRLGVSHTWVTNRLACHQEISLNELQRIAAALEVDITDLLGGHTQPSRRSLPVTERTTHTVEVRSKPQPKSRATPVATRRESRRPTWTSCPAA